MYKDDAQQMTSALNPHDAERPTQAASTSSRARQMQIAVGGIDALDADVVVGSDLDAMAGAPAAPRLRPVTPGASSSATECRPPKISARSLSCKVNRMSALINAFCCRVTM